MDLREDRRSRNQKQKQTKETEEYVDDHALIEDRMCSSCLLVSMDLSKEEEFHDALFEIPWLLVGAIEEEVERARRPQHYI